MLENKRFYEEINFARGIGVCLVILGHSFPDAQLNTYGNSFILKYIFEVIYSFHMPLFFMLSGFVSYKLMSLTQIKDKVKATKNKFLRLMIPYFVISIPSLILKYTFSNLAYNKFDRNAILNVFIGINPNGGLWFLYTLFIVSTIVIFVNKKYFKLLSLIFFILYFIPTENLVVFDIFRICKNGIFYFVGIFTYENYDKVKVIIKDKNVIIASILLLFLGNYTKIVYNFNFNILNFIITISGVVLVLLLSNNINKESTVKNVLNKLGDFSYDIYLISYFIQVPIRVIFFTKLNLNYEIIMFLMFIGGLVVPVIVSKYFIRKISILDMLLIGNYRRFFDHQTNNKSISTT